MATQGSPIGSALHISRAKMVKALKHGTQGGKTDKVTAVSKQIKYWVGTFNGWETVDPKLMKVIHGSGNELRYVSSYDHVVNTPTTPVAGTSLVRVVQYGSQIWVEGFVAGNPLNAPNVPPSSTIDGIPNIT